MKKKFLFQQLKLGADFLLWFAFYFLSAYLLLSTTLAANALSALAATTSSLLLNSFVTPTSIDWSISSTPLLVSQSFTAEIQELCWAKTELAVLAGIIFASLDRCFRKRLQGFLAGFVFLALIVNPLRITLSLASLNEFVHDVLFRATIVLTLVVYYAWWYLFFSREKS